MMPYKISSIPHTILHRNFKAAIYKTGWDLQHAAKLFSHLMYGISCTIST